MTCGPSGLTGVSPLNSVGCQYADRSPLALQVVWPLLSDSTVEAAFVVVLPMNVCRCEAPGKFGKTIGSSPALGRLTEQFAWNSWKPPLFGGMLWDGLTLVTGLGAITHPDTLVSLGMGTAVPDAPGAAVGDAPVAAFDVAAAGPEGVPNTWNSRSEYPYWVARAVPYIRT